MNPPNARLLLEVKGLGKTFHVPRAGLWRGTLPLHAVREVSFTLDAGETLGIVGESGCGKSTLGRSLLRLIEPSQGHILWLGRDVTQLPIGEFRSLRRDMQIIFQDPVASLDPRMTVFQIISEPLRTFEPHLSRAERRARVEQIMQRVGLLAPMINRYPHEFSGGQAQRIGIARAIVTRPKLIVCDEPVSALDVSIQAQIINLLARLKQEMGLTLLFISHDLSVVRHISDRIMVLYMGQVVEVAKKSTLFAQPRHPYTKALLSAVPRPDPRYARQERRIILKGEIPSPLDPPSGCAFRSRCVYAEDTCAARPPALDPHAPGHDVACHFHERIAQATAIDAK